MFSLCNERALPCPSSPLAAGVERNPGFSTLALSRFTSVVLLLTYVAFLAYQLKTHAYLYEDKPDPVEAGSPRGHPLSGGTADEDDDDDDDEVPLLGFWGALGVLFPFFNGAHSFTTACVCPVCICVCVHAVGLGLITIVISILSDYMVKAIEVSEREFGVCRVS